MNVVYLGENTVIFFTNTKSNQEEPFELDSKFNHQFQCKVV